jgi:hypothetical protein
VASEDPLSSQGKALLHAAVVPPTTHSLRLLAGRSLTMIAVGLLAAAGGLLGRQHPVGVLVTETGRCLRRLPR